METEEAYCRGDKQGLADPLPPKVDGNLYQPPPLHRALILDDVPDVNRAAEAWWMAVKTTYNDRVNSLMLHRQRSSKSRSSHVVWFVPQLTKNTTFARPTPHAIHTTSSPNIFRTYIHTYGEQGTPHKTRYNNTQHMCT